MIRAEIQLPDLLYQQVEGLARQLDLTVPDVLRQAAEQMVQRQPKPQPKADGDWRFPEGRHLGPFGTPVEDSRLLANEAPADCGRMISFDTNLLLYSLNPATRPVRSGGKRRKRGRRRIPAPAQRAGKR